MGEKPTDVDEESERKGWPIKMQSDAAGQEERVNNYMKMNTADRVLDKSSPQLRSSGVIKMPPELAEDIPIKGEGGAGAAEKAAGGQKADAGSQRAIRNFTKREGE